MPKEQIPARLNPDLKERIDAEARNDARAPAWLYERLIILGWREYLRKGPGVLKKLKVT